MTSEFKGFDEAAWSFISSIYESGWDSLYTDKNNKSFRQNITYKFTPKIPKSDWSPNTNKFKNKSAEIIRLSPSISARPPKKVLEKSKFFKKKGNKPAAIVKPNNKQSYAQVANPKVTNILKLKEDYWNLPAKKIENIHKIINNLDKIKPRTKITIKGPSHKQIIIPIDKDDKTKFMASSSEYIANINRTLKNIKSDVIADYVYSEHISITIVTNKVASSSDL